MVENLLPAPEEPKLPENVITDEEVINNDTLLANNINNADSAVPQKPVDLFADKTPAVEKEVKDITKEVKTVEVSVKQVKEKAEDPVKKEVAKPVIQTGNWQIQLVASKNKDAVAKTWKDWSSKYADLRNYSYEIQSSDLGSMGMFYRLRVGAFASKEEATKVCASLKAKGLPDCICYRRPLTGKSRRTRRSAQH